MRQMTVPEIDRRVDATLAVFGIVAALAGVIAEQWPATAVVLIGLLVAAAFVLLAYVEPTLRPSGWKRDEAHRAPGGHHCGSCGAAVAGTDQHCAACGAAFRGRSA